jgi:hypothetical protein
MGQHLRRIRNAVLVGVVACFCVAAAGCFGRFPLTSAVYGFNQRASSNRVVQSLVMIALIVIPVYEVSMLVDALVLNVVDFLGGGSSHAANSTRTLADGSTVELHRIDANTVHVRRVDAQGREQSFEVALAGPNAGTLRGANGRVLGTVEQLPDGRLIETRF